MKVVLLKDVAKIGRKHEVKEVSDGHAQNFLIPNRLAEIATEGALRRVETLKTQEGERKEVQEDLLLKNIDDLKNVTVEMEEAANEKGHLFAGIHKEELVPEIEKQTRLIVLPEHIELEKPIKEVGEHEISVRVREKQIKFKLIVRGR
jgi:large subunit ribosomal protein L9